MINKIFFSVCIICLRILVDYTYIREIVPYYSYAGFNYIYNAHNVNLSWVILLGSIIVISPLLGKIGQSSSQAAIILYLIRFVPFTSMLANKGFNFDFVFAYICFWVCFFISLYSMPSVKVRYFHFKSHAFIYSVLIILTVTVIYISGVYAHFRLNFNLLNVYDLREESRHFKLPLILQYLWPAAGNVLPIIMVYYLSQKKRFLYLSIGFIILLNFSINGLKSVLFKMFICLWLSFINPYKIYKWIVIGCPLLCLLIIVVDNLLQSNLLANIITRRVFFIPTLLDSLYYDFINNTHPVFFNSESSSKIAFEIGNISFNKDGMRCNNGLFSDAYMNLGLFGCFVFPMLYTYIFKYCDAAFKYVKPAISVFATLLICTTLGSSILTTSLLTHGLFLLILTCYSMSCYNISHSIQLPQRPDGQHYF